MSNRKRNASEKGVSLMLGVISLVFIIPMLGLSIDAAVLYSIKARLQSSVDGASLAAARALNLGETTASQATAAKQNAVNWFYANFPSGTWTTSSTVMSASNVLVYDDTTNPHVRNVTVTASTNAPTYFMKWFDINSVTVGATGNASRRDVVAMMVLDRSGSMAGTPCTTMKAAAKLFTGQFSAGRDYIGLVSYSDNFYLHSSPTQSFQTVLGYSNSSGSGTGAIDTISCGGGTSTAQAISIAYNELYKTNLPGALNLIMFETDGLPNTLTLNYWPSASAANALYATSDTKSACKDLTPVTTTTTFNGRTTTTTSIGLTRYGGGFTNYTYVPLWTSGYTVGTGSYLSDVPAGMVAGLYADDPGNSNGFYLGWGYVATSVSSMSTTISITASGCDFSGNKSYHVTPDNNNDFAWAPTTDVYGNQLNPTAYTYKTVTTDGSGHISLSTWANYRAAVFNATDYSAYQARTNSTLPVYFFGIGLGSNVDFVLLQRMANDSAGDNYNSPAKYSACANETGCVTYSSQPQGTFVYASDTSDLGRAFLTISSQVLRLSK